MESIYMWNFWGDKPPDYVLNWNIPRRTSGIISCFINWNNWKWNSSFAEYNRDYCMYSVSQEYNKICHVMKVGRSTGRGNAWTFDQDCTVILMTMFLQSCSHLFTHGVSYLTWHTHFWFSSIWLKSNWINFLFCQLIMLSEDLTSERAFMDYGYLYSYAFSIYITVPFPLE